MKAPKIFQRSIAHMVFCSFPYSPSAFYYHLSIGKWWNVQSLNCTCLRLGLSCYRSVSFLIPLIHINVHWMTNASIWGMMEGRYLWLIRNGYMQICLMEQKYYSGSKIYQSPIKDICKDNENCVKHVIASYWA